MAQQGLPSGRCQRETNPTQGISARRSSRGNANSAGGRKSRCPDSGLQLPASTLRIVCGGGVEVMTGPDTAPKAHRKVTFLRSLKSGFQAPDMFFTCNERFQMEERTS